MKYICGPAWDERVVNINPTGKVGIVMSGGMDSWVLYNLLLRQGSAPTIFNIKRDDDIDSIHHLKVLTGRSDIIQIYGTSNNTFTKIREGIDIVLDQYEMDQLYTGVNIIPHIEYFPEFANDNRPRRPWNIDWPTLRVPFHHLYKYHIIDLAMSNHIDLSNTISCTVNADSHCGECWFCKERQWGYDQLGLEWKK